MAGTATSSSARPAGSPKTKKNPSLENPFALVTLYAGNEENAKPFKLHTDFACHYSPVFKAAFNSGFTEGQYQEYRLDVEEEEVVRLLVEWFYTQALNTRQPEEKLDDAATMEEDLILAKLCVLADKLLLPQMQNQVLDRVQEIRNAAGRIPTECLHYVYNNTPPGSPLRRWMWLRQFQGTISMIKDEDHISGIA
ncbi:uncharacterized protein K444DRAFT_709284 [Hyaloscypha bicolor E]|uniref:BTB domain-containing protein n=1 Tax=Hyaloscypha bicolor E TaxID=1095630 RepID=A0A2J6SN76_9HELO|nr:uncharacterized protein K444DRAFT_709284 [Hyaloscypha bicolor E]PMD52237.1 hypothetical protein K444DRAFT_709284 [Hyaloscypha bicolor E]